jgi:hypothetical protein
VQREEERVTTKTLTCNCASRYVRDAEHEGDCDLWLIDEFWAGFLAWDWDREVLVPTPKNPEYHQTVAAWENGDDDASNVEWVNDYLQQKDERTFNGQKVEDVMLTTDAFIDRMLNNSASGVVEDGTWSKDAAGNWVKTTSYPSGATSTTYGTTPSDYDDGWSQYLSDRHCQTPVHMPDGETTVYCTSLSKASEAPQIPDFALYLDGSWRPDSLAIMLPWQDYGLPLVSDAFADYAIKEAFSWANAGAFVEIGCIGAHGRTGVVVACMAILADPELTGPEAVAFVRTAYCHHAIESELQEWWVARFHADLHNLPVPARPVYQAPVTHSPGVVSLPKATSPSGGQTGDPGKPGRQKRARRSKRGGKRVQNHRNRMSQGSRR